MSLHVSAGELTNPQAQQRGVIFANPDPELYSFCDGLGNLVVDVTVKLEDHQVVFPLTTGVCDKPET